MVHEQLNKEKEIQENVYQNLPEKYVLYDLKINLIKTVTTILEENNQKLIDLNLYDFEVVGKMGIKFQLISIYLNDIVANQYKVDNTFFPKILETYEDDFIDRRKSEIALARQTNLGKKGAFYIEFEKNPAMEKSDYRVLLRNEKRIYLYANAYTLNYTMSKVNNAIKSEVDFEEMEKNAKEEMNQMIAEGREYANNLFEGNYGHANIELDVLFKGPKVLIPQNILDNKNRNCLFFNFG